ncbi:hypothetical protein PV783_03170 [Chitinophaga sp. CC14]|uniref:hypothetical protein n=1 Tax=Chitinophaga sp. CC14 TaxID=3029199 RepID=UPI003B7E0C53
MKKDGLKDLLISEVIRPKFLLKGLKIPEVCGKVGLKVCFFGKNALFYKIFLVFGDKKIEEN